MPVRTPNARHGRLTAPGSTFESSADSISLASICSLDDTGALLSRLEELKLWQQQQGFQIELPVNASFDDGGSPRMLPSWSNRQSVRSVKLVETVAEVEDQAVSAGPILGQSVGCSRAVTDCGDDDEEAEEDDPTLDQDIPSIHSTDALSKRDVSDIQPIDFDNKPINIDNRSFEEILEAQLEAADDKTDDDEEPFESPKVPFLRKGDGLSRYKGVGIGPLKRHSRPRRHNDGKKENGPGPRMAHAELAKRETLAFASKKVDREQVMLRKRRSKGNSPDAENKPSSHQTSPGLPSPITSTTVPNSVPSDSSLDLSFAEKMRKADHTHKRELAELAAFEMLEADDANCTSLSSADDMGLRRMAQAKCLPNSTPKTRLCHPIGFKRGDAEDDDIDDVAARIETDVLSTTERVDDRPTSVGTPVSCSSATTTSDCLMADIKRFIRLSKKSKSRPPNRKTTKNAKSYAPSNGYTSSSPPLSSAESSDDTLVVATHDEMAADGEGDSPGDEYRRRPLKRRVPDKTCESRHVSQPEARPIVDSQPVEDDRYIAQVLLNAKLRELDSQIGTLQADRDALAMAKRKLQTEKRQLKADQDALAGERDEMRRKLDEERRRLRRDRQLMERANGTSTHTKADTNVTQLQSKIAKLQEEIDSRQTKYAATLAKQNEQIKKLERENQQLHEDNHRLRLKNVPSKTMTKLANSLYTVKANGNRVAKQFDIQLPSDVGDDDRKSVKFDCSDGSIGTVVAGRTAGTLAVDREGLSDRSLGPSETNLDSHRYSPADSSLASHITLVSNGFTTSRATPSRRSSQERQDAAETGDVRELVSVKKNESKGTTEKIFYDGSVEISYANGNRKLISADAKTVKVMYYNGDIKESLHPSGVVKYFYAESMTWHTTYPDKREVLLFDNGQEEIRQPDGSMSIKFVDGTTKVINADGSETVQFVDGSQLSVAVNGDRTLRLSNGQIETHTAHFKRREYTDGSVKTVYTADGRQETCYANGRRRVKAKDGSLLHDSFDDVHNSPASLRYETVRPTSSVITLPSDDGQRV